MASIQAPSAVWFAVKAHSNTKVDAILVCRGNPRNYEVNTVTTVLQRAQQAMFDPLGSRLAGGLMLKYWLTKMLNQSALGHGELDDPNFNESESNLHSA